MVAQLKPPTRWWKCPSCQLVDKTERHDVHTQFHNCAALNGMNIPLVEVADHDARADARQLVIPREDAPGMAAVRTERGDGSNDVTVFAQTAVSTARGSQ